MTDPARAVGAPRMVDVFLVAARSWATGSAPR